MTSPHGARPTPEAYLEAHATPEFADLRSRFRRYSFPMVVVFLVWYFAFVLCAAFATDWMATPVWGNINIAIIFGLLQFVSTGIITWLYMRHAKKELDPRADSLRAELETVQR